MQKLSLYVVASISLAIVGLAIVRQIVPPELLAANNDVAGNYLQTIGTVYAVLLAFVVFAAWTQFNDTVRTVEHEANELLELFRISRALGQLRACECIREYADVIIADEWPAMARRQKSKRADELVAEVWLALETFEPSGPREEALFARAIACYAEFSDARGERIVHCRQQIPLSLWLLIDAGAIITVISMYLFGIKSFVSHALMTGAMSGSVSFILYLIWDLDNPFEGDWQITAKSFIDVRADMPDAVAGSRS